MLAVAAVDQRLEQRGGYWCADRGEQLGREERAERREQHAVAEHVVAPVPPVVPDPEPLSGEQLGPKQVCDQVLAPRRHNQIPDRDR